jgi:hypothetical protein
LYYIVVEFQKIAGDYASLYYPNKADLIPVMLLILTIYTPFFVQVHFTRAQLDQCHSLFNNKITSKTAVTAET